MEYGQFTFGVTATHKDAAKGIAVAYMRNFYPRIAYDHIELRPSVVHGRWVAVVKYKLSSWV
jgi:hypothetical protein